MKCLGFSLGAVIIIRVLGKAMIGNNGRRMRFEKIPCALSCALLLCDRVGRFGTRISCYQKANVPEI